MLMEVITIDSKAFKELEAKLTIISNFITESHKKFDAQNDDEIWVDNYEVCSFLKLSEKTLYRLRKDGKISYSIIRGHYFYKIKDIIAMLEDNLIKSTAEDVECLIQNHKLYVEQRRSAKKNK